MIRTDVTQRPPIIPPHARSGEAKERQRLDKNDCYDKTKICKVRSSQSQKSAVYCQQFDETDCQGNTVLSKIRFIGNKVLLSVV